MSHDCRVQIVLSPSPSSCPAADESRWDFLVAPVVGMMEGVRLGVTGQYGTGMMGQYGTGMMGNYGSA
jgi:hypothetical protein